MRFVTVYQVTTVSQMPMFAIYFCDKSARSSREGKKSLEKKLFDRQCLLRFISAFTILDCHLSRRRAHNKNMLPSITPIDQQTNGKKDSQQNQNDKRSGSGMRRKRRM